ncbi:MAG: cytochrome c oxidase assembly protein [Pseudomonadota bacterium]|nr:cytochrome c oxidase assembly protein [Pseudomonadota bacterium]
MRALPAVQRRGSVQRPRVPLLAAGLLVLALAWLGPLPQLAQHAFWAHMGMHLAVVAIAAPLLAIALAGSRVDPVPRAPYLFAPMLAVLLEFIVVWGWHAPALHHAASGSGWVRVLEQGSFLVVGLMVWLAAFGGVRPRSRERTAAGIGGLLLTSMHMTLLGVLLTGAPRLLYVHALAGASASGAMRDQQLGGVLMLAVGGVVYLAGALALLAGLLRHRIGTQADV